MFTSISVKSDTIPLVFSVDECLNQPDPELSENELEQLESEGEEITKIVGHTFFGIRLYYERNYEMKKSLIYRNEKVNLYFSCIRLFILLPIFALLIFGIFLSLDMI